VPKQPNLFFASLTAGRFFRVIAPLLLLYVLPMQAQQPSPASSDVAATLVSEQISWNTSPVSEPAAPVELQIAPKNDRLFFVLPNYLMVENRDQFQPLPVRTKFTLSAKTMSDPVTASFLGMIALMGQARNSDPSYGQGFQGYSKRYATLYANTGIGTVMTASVLPTLLHQDPRYFQLGTGGKWNRVKYAVSRIFITRADSGELQFNYSEILGNGVAAGISNAYVPQNQRTFGNTLGVWGTDILLNTFCNVAKEFWPDIRRKLHKPKPLD